MIECIQEEGDFTDWEVSSSSSDLKYIVSVDDEGNLFCSCPDFYYRKSKMKPHISNPESYCKHIRQVLENGEIERSEERHQVCQAAPC